MPATTVGRANGRSITEFTSAFPGNLSLTRTQASAVPATTLTATTITEQIRVSFAVTRPRPSGAPPRRGNETGRGGASARAPGAAGVTPQPPPGACVRP